MNELLNSFKESYQHFNKGFWDSSITEILWTKISKQALIISILFFSEEV